MNRPYKYVGNSYHVTNVNSKAKGELKYASDLALPDMVTLKLVLSTIPHGRIKSIDASEAEKLPKFIACFSYKDNPQKPYCHYRTLPDQELCPEDRYVFSNPVRFVGDVAAVVAAEDKETALLASQLIKIEYEELPSLATPLESLEEGAYKIHEGGNLIGSCQFDRYAEQFSQGQKPSKAISTRTLTQKMNHVAIENHSYMADFSDGQVTIWSPTQGVFGVRTVVADMLDIPYNKVRVIKVHMGGSFGGKQEFIYEPLVALVSMKLKRPVKLHLNRREVTIATIGRSYNSIEMTTQFSEEGKIVDCQIENLFDAGAYAGSSLDQLYAMQTKLTRLYRVPHYHHHGRVVYTTTPVAGGMRGWGAPEVFTSVEIHMDIAAKRLGLNPVDLRMKNLVEDGDIDLYSGLSLGSVRVKDCLAKGIEAFNWNERYAQDPGTGRYRRAVGMACGAHKNGMYHSSPDISTMTINMNEDGTVTLRTSVHDVGCGTLRSMQIIVAEELDMDPDRIEVTEGDTKYSPYDCGTYGSRATYVAGECARRSAARLKDLLVERASELMNVSPSCLTVDSGRIIIYGTDRSISYKELATRVLLEKSSDLIITESHRARTNPGVYLVNFAEVEVDTYTGLVRVTDFLSVNDVGQALNRSMVYRQIEGGVQMALGYGLCEDLAIDGRGIPKNDSFKKYNTLNAVDMPDVKALLIEEGSTDGPFGAKSIGEIATVAGTAAVVNAINHCLNTEITELPLCPERILEALWKKAQ